MQEAAYEEIQERPHRQDPATAMKTIYTTLGFPSNPAHGTTHGTQHGAPHGTTHGTTDGATDGATDALH